MSYYYDVCVLISTYMLFSLKRSASLEDMPACELHDATGMSVWTKCTTCVGAQGDSPSRAQ